MCARFVPTTALLDHFHLVVILFNKRASTVLKECALAASTKALQLIIFIFFIVLIIMVSLVQVQGTTSIQVVDKILIRVVWSAMMILRRESVLIDVSRLL